jgi:hypothetical protein
VEFELWFKGFRALLALELINGCFLVSVPVYHTKEKKISFGSRDNKMAEKFKMAARELFRMVFFFKNGKELTKIVRKLKTRNKKTPSWIFVQWYS